MPIDKIKKMAKKAYKSVKSGKYPKSGLGSGLAESAAKAKRQHKKRLNRAAQGKSPNKRKKK